MSAPIEFDMPHKLGQEAARQRIAGGFGKVAEFIPGSSVTEHRWEGDTLHFTVEAMGQKVAASLTVAETNVHCRFKLPMMLSMFGEKIRAKLEKAAPRLLE